MGEPPNIAMYNKISILKKQIFRPRLDTKVSVTSVSVTSCVIYIKNTQVLFVFIASLFILAAVGHVPK